MPLFRRILVLAVVCLGNFSAAQVKDQMAAERVLGPYWRQIARTSGMIFSGTVLNIESQPAGKGRPLPLIVTTFQVDRPIVGVRAGERLTIREWEAVWSTQRAMLRGQRLLMFLYPPSRLGLTSPVGGRAGQVILDPRGEIVGTSLKGNSIRISGKKWVAEASTAERATAQPHTGAITMAQLERAIRRARLTPTVKRRDHVRTTSGN